MGIPFLHPGLGRQPVGIVDNLLHLAFGTRARWRAIVYEMIELHATLFQNSQGSDELLKRFSVGQAFSIAPGKRD